MHAADQFRKFLPCMGALVKFLSTNWKGAFAVAALPGLIVSAMYSERRKTEQVMKRFVQGSMPYVETTSKCCERKPELTYLKKTILSTEAIKGISGLFFIVVGPNGCGKSWLMKMLCRQNSEVLEYNA